MHLTKRLGFMCSNFVFCCFVWFSRAPSVSLHRQKCDTILMRLIGSFVQFGIAAPTTTRLPVELSVSGAMLKLQLYAFVSDGSTTYVCGRYQKRPKNVIVQCEECLLAVKMLSTSKMPMLNLETQLTSVLSTAESLTLSSLNSGEQSVKILKSYQRVISYIPSSLKYLTITFSIG